MQHAIILINKFLIIELTTAIPYSLKNVHISNIIMLYYDRNDISQRVDIHKTRSSKECDMCRSWYFLYQ